MLIGTPQERVNKRELVLARLRAGPATAEELADVTLNFRARISELRHFGHAIIYEDTSGGQRYRLLVAGEQQPDGARTDSAASRRAGGIRSHEVKQRRQRVANYFKLYPDATLETAAANLKIPFSAVVTDRRILGLSARSEKPVPIYNGPAWKALKDGHDVAMRTLLRAGGIAEVARGWNHERVAAAIAYVQEAINDLQRIHSSLDEVRHQLVNTSTHHH